MIVRAGARYLHIGWMNGVTYVAAGSISKASLGLVHHFRYPKVFFHLFEWKPICWFLV